MRRAAREPELREAGPSPRSVSLFLADSYRGARVIFFGGFDRPGERSGRVSFDETAASNISVSRTFSEIGNERVCCKT